MKTSMATKVAGFVVALGIVTVAVSAVFAPSKNTGTSFAARPEPGAVAAVAAMTSAAMPRVIVVGKRLSSGEKALFDGARQAAQIR